MKAILALVLLGASLGGCAIVPVGYDDGYYADRYHGYYRDGYHRYYRDGYHGYYRDDYYRSDRFDRDRYDWRGYGDGRYYASGVYFRNWDHGQ